ncbi:MAG: DUF167 domain-containing protein [Rickettsiales bacterium]|jgi:uncharacterized protein (TIGR00251 family)|nr:DUF167 domain-containing protein [Rickettsiales bacterium]
MILDLHVVPGARREGFCGEHGGRVKIALRAVAVDGRANEALILFLAAHYDVPKSCVRIVSGLSSRDKRVEVSCT